MEAKFDKIQIQKITFETGDSDVLVNANIQQGKLSYDSQLIIGYSDLNLLINKMQQLVNDDQDISEMFESEKMYNGNLMYTLDIEKKIDQNMLIEQVHFNNGFKQIRA
jgi:hypothetical protein